MANILSIYLSHKYILFSAEYKGDKEFMVPSEKGIFFERKRICSQREHLFFFSFRVDPLSEGDKINF